jgi:hypothetical protein
MDYGRFRRRRLSSYQSEAILLNEETSPKGPIVLAIVEEATHSAFESLSNSKSHRPSASKSGRVRNASAYDRSRNAYEAPCPRDSNSELTRIAVQAAKVAKDIKRTVVSIGNLQLNESQLF